MKKVMTAVKTGTPFLYNLNTKRFSRMMNEVPKALQYMRNDHLQAVIERLHKAGSIKFVRHNESEWRILLTQRGIRSLDRAKKKSFPKENWDGSWRLVIFDIPENERAFRDIFRRTLKNEGFVEFQKSIWIFPYCRRDFIRELVKEFDLDESVHYIETKLLDDDTDLLSDFNLCRK